MVAFILSNENANLNYFVTLSGRFRMVSQPKFESQPTLCGPLVYCYERWATIIVHRQAITVLNASFHVGGPLMAGALRPVPRGPHS